MRVRRVLQNSAEGGHVLGGLGLSGGSCPCQGQSPRPEGAVPEGHAFHGATPAPLRQAGSGRPAMDGHVGKTGPPEVNSVFLVLTRFKNKLKSRHSLKIMNRAGEQSFACVFIPSSAKPQFKN